MNKETVFLGSYPQDRGLEKEPIEWIVLKKEEHRCLCISKYLLDCKPYHDFSDNVTWQDSTLRSWLNHEFLVSAFSAEEREKIILSTVKNPAGNTQDQIFLLSTDEVDELFGKDSFEEAKDHVGHEERGAATTARARAQGAWFMEGDGEEKNKGCWWLRYYGNYFDEEEGKDTVISCVNFDGYIERAAQSVEETNCCIRPAFWLRTD